MERQSRQNLFSIMPLRRTHTDVRSWHLFSCLFKEFKICECVCTVLCPVCCTYVIIKTETEHIKYLLN